MATTAPPRTRSGTQKLSDVARHVVLPSGVTSTGWPSVRDKAHEFGVLFDPWQDGAGRAILAKRADGTYAASIGGVVLSIPRQVGKTFLLGAIIFALCVLQPNHTVIWTAHRSRTADETFENMRTLAKRRKIAPYIAKITSGGGEGAIYFRNGSRVLFGARESGFGRGFEKVTVLMFDEAQILTIKAMEDMVPAANQGENALVLFAGTPPRPIDPGEMFSNRRYDALSGDDEDTLYIEFSADKDAKLDDRKQWARANPSYPKRTPETAMLRMKKMLGEESFKREGLGIWDELATVHALIPAKLWTGCHVEIAPREGVVGYGVKFSADGVRVALAAARKDPIDGAVHVEVVKAATLATGTGWLVDWLVQRVRTSVGVIVDGKSGQGPFVTALLARKVPERLILTPTVDQVIAAHAGILDAVQSEKLTHYGQTGLDSIVARATKRPIGKAGGWGWQGIDDELDTTPLDAVTLAHWVAATSRKKPKTGATETGRTGVVL